METAGTQVQPECLLIAFISYYCVIDAVTSSRCGGVTGTKDMRVCSKTQEEQIIMKRRCVRKEAALRRQTLRSEKKQEKHNTAIKLMVSFI